MEVGPGALEKYRVLASSPPALYRATLPGNLNYADAAKRRGPKKNDYFPEVTPVTVSNTNDSVKRFRNLPHSNNHTLLPSLLSVSQIDRGNCCSSQTPALTFMKKRGDERSDQITDSLSTY